MSKRKADDDEPINGKGEKKARLVNNATSAPPRAAAAASVRAPPSERLKIEEMKLLTERDKTRDLVRKHSMLLRKKQKNDDDVVLNMQWIFLHWLLYELWSAGSRKDFPESLEKFFAAALNELGFVKSIDVYMIVRRIRAKKQLGYQIETKAIGDMIAELEGSGTAFTQLVADASDMMYVFAKDNEPKKKSGLELRQELKEACLDMSVWHLVNPEVWSMPTIDRRIERLCEKCVDQLWESCTKNPKLPLVWCWSVAGNHPEIEALHGILSEIDVIRNTSDFGPGAYGKNWTNSTLGAARTLHLALEIINWDFGIGGWKMSGVHPLLVLDGKRTEGHAPVVYVSVADLRNAVHERELIAKKTHARFGRLKFLQTILVQVITNCADWFDQFWATEKNNVTPHMPPQMLATFLLRPKIPMARLATQINHLEETFASFFLDLINRKSQDGFNHGERFEKAKAGLKTFRASLLKNAYSLLSRGEEKKGGGSSSSSSAVLQGTVQIDWSANYTERYITGIQYADWRTWCASIQPVGAHANAYRYNDRTFYCSNTSVAKLPFHLYENAENMMGLRAEARKWSSLREPSQLFNANAGGVAMLWSTSQLGVANKQYLMTFYLPPVMSESGAIGVHMTPTSMQVLLVLQYMSMGNQRTKTAYDVNPQLAQREMWDAFKHDGGGERFDLRVVDYLRCHQTTMGVLQVQPLIVLQPTNKLKQWAATLLASNRGTEEQEAKLNTEALAVAKALMNTEDPSMPGVSPELMVLFRGMAAVVHQLTAANLDKHAKEAREAIISASWEEEKRSREADEERARLLNLSAKEAKEHVGKVVAMNEEVELEIQAAIQTSETAPAKLAAEVTRLKKKLDGLHHIGEQLLETMRQEVAESESRFEEWKEWKEKKENREDKEKFAEYAREMKEKRELEKQRFDELKAQKKKAGAEYNDVRVQWKQAIATLKRQELVDLLDSQHVDRMASYRQLGLLYANVAKGANFNEKMMDTGAGESDEDEEEEDGKKSLARDRFRSLADESTSHFIATGNYSTRDPDLKLILATQQLAMQNEESRNADALSRVQFAIQVVAHFFGEGDNSLYHEAKAAAFGSAMEEMGLVGDDGIASRMLLDFEKLATRLADLTVICESNFRRESESERLRVFEEIVRTQQTVNDLLGSLPQLSASAFRELAATPIVAVDPAVEVLEDVAAYNDRLAEERKEKGKRKQVNKMSDDNAPVERKRTKPPEADAPMETSLTWANLEHGLKLLRGERSAHLKSALADREEKSLDHKTWRDRLVPFLMTVYPGDRKDAEAVTIALRALCAKTTRTENYTVLWLYALHVSTARRAAETAPTDGSGFTTPGTERQRIILQHIALADRTLRLCDLFIQKAVKDSPSLFSFFSMHTALLFSLSDQVCPHETTWPDSHGDEYKAKLRSALETYTFYTRLPEREKDAFTLTVLVHGLQLSRWDGDDLEHRIEMNRAQFEVAHSDWGERRAQAMDAESDRDWDEELESDAELDFGLEEPPKNVHLVALYGSYAALDGLDRPSFVSAIADAVYVGKITQMHLRSRLVPDWSVNDLHFLEYDALQHAFWTQPMVTLRDLDDIIWRQLSLYSAVNYSVDPAIGLLVPYETELKRVPEELKVDDVDIDSKNIRVACDYTRPLTDFILELLRTRTEFRNTLNSAKGVMSLEALSTYMHKADLGVRLAVMGEIAAVFMRADYPDYLRSAEHLSTQLHQTCLEIVQKEEERVKGKQQRTHRVALAVPAERAPLFSPRAPGYCAIYWPDQLLAAIRDWLLRVIDEATIGQFGDSERFDETESYAFLKKVAVFPRDIIQQDVVLFYRTRAERLRESNRWLFTQMFRTSQTKTKDLVWHTRYFQHTIASNELHRQLANSLKGTVEALAVRKKLTNPLSRLLLTMRRKAGDLEPEKESKEVAQEVARAQAPIKSEALRDSMIKYDEEVAKGAVPMSTNDVSRYQYVQSSDSKSALAMVVPPVPAPASSSSSSMDTDPDKPTKKKNRRINEDPDEGDKKDDDDRMMQGRYEAELSTALEDTLVIRD